MSEVKYKAKRSHNEQWVYGIPFTMNEGEFNRFELMHVCDPTGYWSVDRIIPETACRYTGMKDNKQQEIYDGDILRIAHKMINYQVEYFMNLKVFQDKTGAWRVKYPNGKLESVYDIRKKVEVIGNFKDNPELLVEEYEINE